MRRISRIAGPLLVGAAAFLAAFAARAELASCATPTISVEEIAGLIDEANQKGERLRGYGLTVFEGTRIERFGVEFRSVLWNMEGREHRIWSKLYDDPRRKEKILEQAGLIEGMSGSPIYVTVGGVDRLVGAASFGYPFNKECLAGITPIEYMLEAGNRPLERPGVLWAANPADAASESAMPRLIDTPVAIRGFSAKAIRMVSERLAGTHLVPMAGSGAGQWALKYKDEVLRPGSAIGVQLMSGDFEWTAAGTVTWVDGDRFLAFGHAFNMLGEVAYPVTTAYVQGVVPRLSSSMKMAAPIREVGVMTQDRNSAVAGLIGKSAKTFPARITLRNLALEAAARKENKNAAPIEYNVRIINDESMGPSLLDMLYYNALSLSEPGGTDNTVFVKLKARFKGYEPIEISDAYYNYGDAYSWRLLQPVWAVLFNQTRKMELEGVEIELAIDHDMKVAFIKSVRPAADKVKAGGSLDVAVTLRAYDREDFVKSIKVPIPADSRPGRLQIQIAGGGSFTPGGEAGHAGMLEEGPSAFGGGVQSIENMIAQFNERARTDSIVAAIRYPVQGIRLKGRAYPNVPFSVRSTLLSNDEMQVGEAEQTAKSETLLPWAVFGGQTIQIEVEE